VSLLLSTLAFADSTSVQKYRNYTPQQINDLPEIERNSQVPTMYTMAARHGLSVGAEILFGMELNGLMYPGLHDYNRAVKSFQADLGDIPTGTLTVWQIHSLKQRFEIQKLSEVGFPDHFHSSKDTEHALVEGTFTIFLDEEFPRPINHVKVKCERKEKRCQVEEQAIAVPDDMSWSQTYSVSVYDTLDFEISRWEGDHIDATMRLGSGSCGKTTLNLNFKTQEFYYIIPNAGGTGVPCADQLRPPSIRRVVNGKEIIREEFNKIGRAAYKALSSDFRKRVETLGQSLKTN
jgi:hypothetical protein